MKKYIIYFVLVFTVAVAAYYNNRKTQVSSDIVFDPKLSTKEDNSLDGKIVQQQELKIEKKEEDIKKEIKINNSQKETKVIEDKENKKDSEIKKIDPVFNKGDIPKTTVGQTVDKLKKEGTQQFYGNLQNYIQSSLARTEVSITAQQFNKPLFSILTTQPFIQSGDTTWFYQGSVFRTEEEGTMRNTVNLGTGLRELVYDKKVMLGANVFYDHEFPYDHQRVGFGLEARTSVGEINANQYYKSSGVKTNKYGFSEQALDGTDIEFGTHMPHIPAWKIFAKYFSYNISGSTDLSGKEYSTEFRTPLGLTVVAGKKFYENNIKENQQYVMLSYSLALGKDPSKDIAEIITSNAYDFQTMEKHTLDKVRRENLIVKKVSGGLEVVTR
jgi:adhesin/invasin